MKQHYDKILLALALILLCAGIGLVFVQSSDSAQSLASISQNSPTGKDFTVPPKQTMTFSGAEWPAPVDQGLQKEGLWVYGVFTPPKIWWNEETSQFEANPPVPPKVRPPFGVEFAGVERKPYQLQLVGSVEVADGTVLMFTEDGVPGTLRVRKGETVKGQSIEFKVVDTKVVRQQKDDGTLDRRLVASIDDITHGKKLELNDKERLYMDSEREILVRAIKEPASVWKFKAAPASFEYAGGTFTIKEINFDTPAIKVEKVLPDFKDSEVVVLTPTLTSPESEKPAPEQSKSAPAPAGPPADLFK